MIERIDAALPLADTFDHEKLSYIREHLSPAGRKRREDDENFQPGVMEADAKATLRRYERGSA